MRVVIAGGGSVGRFIAEQLQDAGHDVLIIDQDPAVVKRHQSAGEPRGVAWFQADACEVTQLAEAKLSRGRRHGRGHRRRRGQPGDLAAVEAGVRRAPRRGPGEQPQERVDVQRDVGRRRRRVDAAPAHRARGGGGQRRHLRAPPVVRGRARPSWPRSPSTRSRLAVDKEIQELGLPRDSTVVAVVRAGRVVVPRGDTMVRVGDEVIVLVTEDSEDEVRHILTGRVALSPSLSPVPAEV